jgi:GNAT superfamily N-acetyltransferase
MGVAWQIRSATLEDAEGLKKSMESAYAPYQERMGGERLPPMDVDYSSEIANYPTWVVESVGEILGGLIMVFENENAAIANIAVDSKFQGKGIGGELLKFAESQAKRRNFPQLYLTTHILLKENLSLYRHLGWKEIGRDNTKVFMKKSI